MDKPTMIRGIVYQIKHKDTGKIYVGSTTKQLHQRIGKHWTTAKSNSKESRSVFYLFMNQYKYEDFDYVALVEQDYKNKQELEDDEIKYIQTIEKDLLLNSKRTLRRCYTEAYKKQLARKKEKIPCKICNEPISRSHMKRHYEDIHIKSIIKKIENL